MPAATDLRRRLLLALGLETLLAGCAAPARKPGEDLLASAQIVRETPVERAAEIEIALFSQRAPGERLRGWEPYLVDRVTPRTSYHLVDAGDGVTALEASAEHSASGLYRRIRIDPKRNPILEWRWKVVQPPAGADPRTPARDDSAARVVVSFHGDVNRLEVGERALFRLYKGLTGQPLPYAMLMYIWAGRTPVETLISGKYTERIKMIVVDSEPPGQWRNFRRDVPEDYRRAFGEDPWDIVAVGVLTDSDDTSQSASALYGDITARAGPA